MSQSHAWFQNDHEQAESHSFCGGSVLAFSRTSPAKTTPNEDAAAIVELSPGHGVLVVADGVGGASAGDRAARLTVERVVEFAQKAAPDASVRSDILDAIETANREVLSWGVGAGSTLVVAEYIDGSLRSFHVGDSTMLICSNRGRTKFSTVAHAPVAMAVEIGVIEQADALNHEDRHIISNCIGSTEMKIELGPTMPMATRDTLVVGSDGLFDNVTHEEIVEIVRAGQLDQQVDILLTLARSRMQNIDQLPSKPDDLTVLCFRQ